MKRINLIFTILLSLVVCSCTTGYSKKTYIKSLDKYVSKIEKEWKSYDDDDWEKVDKRMEAFDKKYDKYSEDFTSEEFNEVTIIIGRYALLAAKATGKDVLDGVKGFFDDNKSELREYKEKMEDIDKMVEEFADSISALFEW